PELLANARVAQVLLPEPAHLLVEVVAVRLGAVGPDPDAQSGVGRFHTVEHLPRAAGRSAAARQVEIGERLSARPQHTLVAGPRSKLTSEAVHAASAAVNQRSLGEVGDMRDAPTIEMCEQAGEHPEVEVGRQVQTAFPLAALEPRQPLSGGTMCALSL